MFAIKSGDIFLSAYMAGDYGEMARFGFCTKREIGVATMTGAGKSAQRLIGFDVKISDCNAALM